MKYKKCSKYSMVLIFENYVKAKMLVLMAKVKTPNLISYFKNCLIFRINYANKKIYFYLAKILLNLHLMYWVIYYYSCIL